MDREIVAHGAAGFGRGRRARGAFRAVTSGGTRTCAGGGPRSSEEETGLVVELDELSSARTPFRPQSASRRDLVLRVTGRGPLRAGDDAVDVGFFGLDRLPAPIAFDTDERVIEKLREDLVR
jgi:hypothetical protein